MPFGPYYASLPKDGNGHAYVTQPMWDQAIGNFVNWQGNVNGGGYTLSNVAISASSVSNCASISNAGASLAINPTGGNVAIGTSGTPLGELSIAYRGTPITSLATYTAGVDQACLAYNVVTNFPTTSASNRVFDICASGGAASYIRFMTAANGTTAPAARMTIDPSGNVGIGTTAPSAPLCVSAAQVCAQFVATANPQLQVQDNYSGGLFYIAVAAGAGSYLSGSSAKDGLLYAASGAGVGIGTGATVRLYVASGGNVGIGTQGPSYSLQLATDSAAKPSTSTWTVASDSRLKQRIQSMSEDSVGILNKLNWVRYEYNGLGGTQSGAPGIGLVAQEVRPHLADAVRSVKAKLSKDDAADTDLLGLDYHAVIVHTARAIQQIDARLKKAGF